MTVASSKQVTVRMYNVGFGDAFLLQFPDGERTRRVLIDCGSHSIGPGPVKMKEMVEQIIKDVTEDGVPRIDVVVCTHRHQDHVSGFRYKSWNRVEVGEVWMPWTEHPTEEAAKEIRERQSKRARSLALSLAQLGAAGEVQAIVKNSLTNAVAMHTLHKGFRSVRTRRFLPLKQGAGTRTFTTPVLPGVSVHVLGPSRNPDVIRDMEPGEGESYLRFMLSQSDKPHQRLRPFRSRWALSEAEFLSDFGHLRLTEHQRRAIAKVGFGSELELAANLEKAVNGTSLMLMFVIGRAHLLFSGDAQWGTWTAALSDPEWSALLAKTTFYKVGHHASHNATPPAFVKRHPTGKFAAMISTRSVTKWPDIPRGPLLDALRKRSDRIVRSDRADVADPSGLVRRRTYVEMSVNI